MASGCSLSSSALGGRGCAAAQEERDPTTRGLCACALEPHRGQPRDAPCRRRAAPRGSLGGPRGVPLSRSLAGRYGDRRHRGVLGHWAVRHALALAGSGAAAGRKPRHPDQPGGSTAGAVCRRRPAHRPARRPDRDPRAAAAAAAAAGQSAAAASAAHATGAGAPAAHAAVGAATAAAGAEFRAAPSAAAATRLLAALAGPGRRGRGAPPRAAARPAEAAGAAAPADTKLWRVRQQPRVGVRVGVTAVG